MGRQGKQRDPWARQRGASVLEIGIILTLIALVIVAVIFIANKPHQPSANPPGTDRQAGIGSPQPPAAPAAAKTDALNELMNGFVKIPAGEFIMGSANGNPDEKPAHPLRISRPFEMGKYEVTQAQWEAVMGDNPSWFKGASRPVEQVSWDDVREFIQKLNERDEGYVYRLPTEAEWEYACRAGRPGDDAGKLDQVAWYDENADSMTHAVGTRAPNAWGLYDMHGNVFEWCQDAYDKDYYGQSPGVDPQGPPPSMFRVKRGGSWAFPAKFLRASARDLFMPSYRYNYVGFRLVRTAR